MKKNLEVQAAFELWNKMVELEKILCNHYFDAFYDLMLDEAEQEGLKALDDDLEDEDPFIY